MDTKSRGRILDIVEELTHSGTLELDKPLITELKNYCKKSSQVIQIVYSQVREYLEEEHAQVRFSCFLVIKELFNRSHDFRNYLINDFLVFIELVTGIGKKTKVKLLPKQYAEKLRRESLVCMNEWNLKYGKAYRKLELGVNYLSNTCGVDFEKVKEELRIEEEKERSAETQKAIQLRQCYYESISEIKDKKEEVAIQLNNIENLFKLLFREQEKSDEFKKSDEFSAESQENYAATLPDSGLTNSKYVLEFNVSKTLNLQVNENNAVLLNNLKDLGKQNSDIFIPLLEKWYESIDNVSELEGNNEEFKEIKKYVKKNMNVIGNYQEKIVNLRINVAALANITEAQNQNKSREDFETCFSSDDADSDDAFGSDFNDSDNEEVSVTFQGALLDYNPKKQEEKRKVKEEKRKKNNMTAREKQRLQHIEAMKDFMLKKKQAELKHKRKKKHEIERAKKMGSDSEKHSLFLANTSELDQLETVSSEYQGSGFESAARFWYSGEERSEESSNQLKDNIKKRIRYEPKPISHQPMKICGVILSNGEPCDYHYFDESDRCPVHDKINSEIKSSNTNNTNNNDNINAVNDKNNLANFINDSSRRKRNKGKHDSSSTASSSSTETSVGKRTRKRKYDKLIDVSSLKKKQQRKSKLQKRLEKQKKENNKELGYR